MYEYTENAIHIYMYMYVTTVLTSNQKNRKRSRMTRRGNLVEDAVPPRGEVPPQLPGNAVGVPS